MVLEFVERLGVGLEVCFLLVTACAVCGCGLRIQLEVEIGCSTVGSLVGCRSVGELG